MFKITAEEKQFILGLRKVKAGSGTVPDFKEFVDKYVVEDYPFGRLTTKATFEVVKKGKKQSVTRITIDPKTGRINKPKRITFGSKATIGVTKDGKVYPVIFSVSHITVWSGNMKHSLATVFPDDDGFKELYSKFK